MERQGTRAQVRPGPWEQALQVSLKSPEFQPQGWIPKPTETFLSVRAYFTLMHKTKCEIGPSKLIFRRKVKAFLKVMK